MDALCYDIMEMIGHEVQIVRETAQIKGNYQKVVYDVNSIHSRCYILDDLDEVPADYKGTPGLCECGCCGVTCIINPEQD